MSPLTAAQEAAFEAAMNDVKIGIGERGIALDTNNLAEKALANRKVENGLLGASGAAPDADVKTKLRDAGSGFATASEERQNAVIRGIGSVIRRHGTSYAIRHAIIALPLVAIAVTAPTVMTLQGVGQLVDHHDGTGDQYFDTNNNLIPDSFVQIDTTTGQALSLPQDTNILDSVGDAADSISDTVVSVVTSIFGFLTG
ncbi:hypothetical protein DL93DRAFT_2172342 [Clavulina sp. PMI_390]|nr:hypothetical protein DL93DRAFT_2172342 [Clavulina sp. PMI_390]